jgi:competence protein ComEA
MANTLRYWVPASLFSVLLVAPARPADFPEGAGKEILLNACVGCHKPDDIPSYKRTPRDWETIVSRMIQRGARVSETERETLVGYLARNFAKVEDPDKINVNTAAAKELETGLSVTAQEAQAIVSYRERHGNFRAWGDLLLIYGVDGKKIYAARDKMSF